MTPEERARRSEEERLGDLAAGLVQPVCDMALALREEDATEFARLLSRATGGAALPERARALFTVMASMIPVDDMSAADMLSWVTWDQHRRPLGGPVRSVPAPGRWRALDQLQPCGTYAAYMRHKDRNELIDDDCRAAARAYWRDHTTGTGTGRALKPCGTPAAYRRHKKRGEPVDAACEAANRAYWQGLNANRYNRPA